MGNKGPSHQFFFGVFWRLSKILSHRQQRGVTSFQRVGGRSVRSKVFSTNNNVPHSKRGIVFLHGRKTTWASAIQSIASLQMPQVFDGRSGEATKATTFGIWVGHQVKNINNNNSLLLIQKKNPPLYFKTQDCLRIVNCLHASNSLFRRAIESG